MKIELKKITAAELSKGYQDNAEAGVVGFGGGMRSTKKIPKYLSIFKEEISTSDWEMQRIRWIQRRF